MSVPCRSKPGFRILIALYIEADNIFIFLLEWLFDCGSFVCFLTELEQAQEKEGLGETERLLGGQEDASDVNQGETTGSAEGQIQNL